MNISAGHRPAGVVLADGAADLIRATRARAAAPGDFGPVDGVTLRVEHGPNHKGKRNQYW